MLPVLLKLQHPVRRESKVRSEYTDEIRCTDIATLRSHPVDRVACWVHARRKIHDVYISSKSTTAEETLKRISELYAIEDEIRGLPESEGLAVRQQRSKALLTSLHEWMVEKNGTLSKKSRLGEAFSHVLNQWDELCYYSDDGLAEAVNRPGFPGEYFICELRLPDHRFRWKHNKLFLLLPEGYDPAFPAIVDCYTSPPT